MDFTAPVGIGGLWFALFLSRLRSAPLLLMKGFLDCNLPLSMATKTLPQGKSRPGAEGYESKDASVPWVFGIVIFLACCGIVIQAASSWASCTI